MTVGCVRTEWIGSTGGPGLSQTWFQLIAPAFWDSTTAQGAVNAVRGLFAGTASFMPDDITTTTSPAVDLYNETTDTLIGTVVAGTAPLPVVGTNIGTFSAAAGYKLNFNTGVIRNGRRVRGSMFMVPAGSSVFNTSGTVASTARTTILTAVATFRTAVATANLEQVVYSRPTPALIGAASPVDNIDVGTKSAILRGRRD